jgi:signal transduction histidine kinase
LLTAVSISAIHFHFFKLERMRLIELNLQQNASLLANSDLKLSRKEFSDQGQYLVEQIIGDDKVNMIVAIYNRLGNALYMNDNALIFKVPPAIRGKFKEWDDLETKDYFIKFLTVKDESQGRIIRVGMILNQSLLRWKDLNQRILVFASIIISVIAIIAFFLTYVVFKPVQHLADQVMIMGERIERGEFSDLRSWFEILNKNKKNKDEFQTLISALDKLAKKITTTQEQTKRWSALMAHELKTPMTILRNAVDNMARETKASPKLLENVEQEFLKLEAIITDFLEWASLENDASKPEIHVLPIQKRCHDLIDRLQEIYPFIEITLTLTDKEEQKIFCNPVHFDQVLNNIIVNSIKYGQKNKVEIHVGKDFIEISDHGPGLPESVLKNYGKPFNKYKQGKIPGFGLGLAWVNTISKKYDWKVEFIKNDLFKVRITFPIMDH